MIIAALNADFRGVPFESLQGLMPEENVLLPSVCSKCYNEAAIYSVTREPRIAAELILQKSKSYGLFLAIICANLDNVKLGGAETWMVLCRGCRPEYQAAFDEAMTTAISEHTSRMHEIIAQQKDQASRLRDEAATQYKQDQQQQGKIQ